MRVKNTHKQTLTNKTKISEQKTTKATYFAQIKLTKKVKVACFAFFGVFRVSCAFFVLFLH